MWAHVMKKKTCCWGGDGWGAGSKLNSAHGLVKAWAGPVPTHVAVTFNVIKPIIS